MSQTPEDSIDAVEQVGREQLPESVQSRLAALENVYGDSWRYHSREEGFRLDVPDAELSYFPAGYGPLGCLLAPLFLLMRLAPVWLLLPYLAGFGLAIYGVYSMLEGGMSVEWWVVAAITIGVGAALSTLAVRVADHNGPMNRRGLCLVPEGLLRIRETGYQFVPREHVESIALDGHRMYATVLPERVKWSIVAGGAAAKRRSTLDAWFAGSPDWVETKQRSLPTLGKNVKTVLIMLVVPVPICAFFWVTMVMPTTSEKGQLAEAFFEDLRRGAFDDAYARLSDRARQQTSREEFEAAVPDAVRRSTGTNVNAVSGSIGTAIGAEACVDGWLYLPDGDGWFFYRLELSSTEDGWAVDDYAEGGDCNIRDP